MLSKELTLKSLIFLSAGSLFGFGLALSGMTDPGVVIGFLDLFGSWNLSLIFVMVGAIAVTSLGYLFIFTKKRPIFDSQFFLPKHKTVDKPLIAGAILFGLGWGLYGFCPGPALASLASLEFQTFVFVAAMVSGMVLADKLTLLSKK